jgi:hypothetical protein
LGFPVAFSELLAQRSTPSFDPSGPEIENPLAYRETDRQIYRTFRKKPLSGSFDKLGNNATVAMVHTRRLSTAGQLRVAPAPTAFQGASRRFIPHLGRGIRRLMTPVAR